MTYVQETFTPVKNQLIDTILSYGKTHELSTEQLAKRIGISYVYLIALMRGDRPIGAMDVRAYRKVATALEISCFSAMMLAGCLTADDFSTREKDVVSSAAPDWKKSLGLEP